jgi:hypothetical protein
MQRIGVENKAVDRVKPAGFDTQRRNFGYVILTLTAVVIDY